VGDLPGRVALVLVALLSVTAAVPLEASAANKPRKPAATTKPPSTSKSPKVPPKATLTLRDERPSGVERSYGEDRGSHTITLVYDSDRALSSLPTVVLPEPSPGQGDKAWKGQTSATGELIGTSAVKVTIALDPEDSVRGTYDTHLKLIGDAIKGASTQVDVTFTRSPCDALVWLWAVVALILGVGLGGLLRWLAETGTTMRALLDQYEIAVGSLPRDPAKRPSELVSELRLARQQLVQGDSAGAEARLKAINDKLPAALHVFGIVSGWESKLSAQETRIRKASIPRAEQLLLQGVIAIERGWLPETAQAAYPSPDEHKDQRDKRDGYIGKFGAFIDHYVAQENRSGKWAKALGLYLEGEDEFDRADEAWHEAPAATAASSLLQEESKTGEARTGDGDEDEGAPAGRLAGFKWMLFRHAPAFVGVLTALGLVIVGLITVFKVDSMFLTNDIGDFLTLLAWGFGSATVGITTAQLAGKLAPTAPAAPTAA
jgi:hypothetical protein